jgi:hypothetical protein
MAKVSTISKVKTNAGPDIRTIPIANIENKFDVRQVLDDDRVIYLAELYEGGVNVEPIKVILVTPKAANPSDQKYAFVDGRHRAAGRALLGLPTIEAEVVSAEELDMAGLYAESLKANWGGAKPPTRQDIRHTIQRMLESGATFNRVRAALAFLPPSVFRRYAADAMSSIGKHKMLMALEAIAGGMKLPAAAEKYGIDPEKLRDAITGQKKKGKTTQIMLSENKMFVTNALRSANQKVAGKMKALLVKVEDSEMPVHVMMDIIEAWESSVSASQHRIKDWKERLQSIAGGLGKGVEED